jgi:sensor domain CHASE-containing protein
MDLMTQVYAMFAAILASSAVFLYFGTIGLKNEPQEELNA